MSDPRPVAYARSGGRPPVDDERLEIAPDGTWRLWRTLGGPRVGAFAGRLRADRRRRLSAAVVEIGAGARSTARARPDAAAETFQVGELALHVPSGTPISGAWGRLAGLLRRWCATLTSEPDAALELLPGTAAEPARLVRLGSGDLRVHPETLHVEVYARDSDGLIVDRVVAGEGRVPESPRGPGVLTGAQWHARAPIPRAVAARPGDTIETWLFLDVDGPYGPARARLIAAARPSGDPTRAAGP